MSAVEGWKTGRLGELCSIEIGGTPSRSNPDFWDASKDTSNHWVSIRDLNKTVITQTAEHISDSGVKHSNVKLQNPGTVLLSFKLSIGRVAFAGVPLYTNEAIAGLNSNQINTNYLFHGLHHWDLLQGVDQAIKGATLNKEKLKKITFKYPGSLSEQTKIAEILSTVDRAIEQTEALIAKQQRIKTGLMQDLLTRGIDEHGNLRSEQTHKFKDSPLGRIPVEWKATTLKAIGTWLSGGTPSKANPDFWNGSIPWVSPKDMKSFDIEDTTNRITDQAVQFGTTLLPESAVLLVVRGMILDHAFPVCYTTRPMAFNQDVKAILTTPSVVPRYLAYWLVATGYAILRIVTTATHGTKRFDMNDLYNMDIALPEETEQRRIVQSLDEFQSESLIAKVQAEKLRFLKTALMQDLLTGKKRVTTLLKDMEAETL
ncbi:MAG: restriction endonuclease subunit S [Syntrophaceae bacterium]